MRGTGGSEPAPDRLERLLRPRSVAVIGGGSWGAAVLRGCRAMGFDGPLWAVHPVRSEVGGVPAFASVEALPGVPDAAFVGVNRTASVAALRALSARGVGGAVCFASGFEEAEAEISGGAALQAALVMAAQGCALLGPNCYGFVNALDRVALWPDVHGLVPVPRGVAILSQSSNVALNLTMQRRGLPIGFLGCVGNQAACDMSELGHALLEDARVTALGLYVEGLADLARFETLARRAAALGKRIVVLKTGATEQARAGAVSHTASLVGSDAGAEALFRRLGVARVRSPEALVEALKLAHLGAHVPAQVVSMSCSGGEAALMADMGAAAGLLFPPLTQTQRQALRAALGPKVALANPLDYHTYVWADQAAMAQVFAAAMRGAGLGIVVLDFPRQDRCAAPDWPLVIDALEAARSQTSTRAAVLSSLPEGLPEAVCLDLMARGIAPLCGMQAALEAVAALQAPQAPPEAGLLLPGPSRQARLVPEAAAKAALARHGLVVPLGACAASVPEACAAAVRIGFPVALKRDGAAHKTDSGGVALGLGDAQAVARAGSAMGGPFFVEQMVPAPVAELLVGVVRDPAHGFVLTLAAGGVRAALLADQVCALLPVQASDVLALLGQLRLAPVLAGWRGAPGADMQALVRAILAVQAYVMAHSGAVEEVEINPLMALPDRAVAVDALIRRSE